MDVSELTARLRDLGIRQEGDPVLRQECAPFDLLAERAESLALWERLRGYVDRLQEIYPFTKGVGLAAPQIGVARAMSIVRTPVPRPLAIRVQLTTLDGERNESAYDRGLARLVLHEIDHLRGMLTRDLVRPDARLVPLAEYRGASHEWRY
jgi:peptide deformylase